MSHTSQAELESLAGALDAAQRAAQQARENLAWSVITCDWPPDPPQLHLIEGLRDEAIEARLKAKAAYDRWNLAQARSGEHVLSKDCWCEPTVETVEAGRDA